MAKKPPEKTLTGAAQRALAEAEARRRQRDEHEKLNPRAKERGGRKGPEPTRYGDWERGGILSDF